MIYTQYIFLTDKWPQDIINLVSKVKATVPCSVVQRTVVNICLKCCRRWPFLPPIKSNTSTLYHPPKNFNIYFKRKEVKLKRQDSKMRAIYRWLVQPEFYLICPHLCNAVLLPDSVNRKPEKRGKIMKNQEYCVSAIF